MSIIKQTDSVKYSLFNTEPTPTINEVYVYKNNRGDYRIVESGEQLTNAELKSKKYTTRYLLKYMPLKGSIYNEFPSRDENISYAVSLNYTAEVSNPELYIKS